MTTPRYLTSFTARHSMHRFTDILIVGGGIAGLRAALEVPADLDVLVVTKARITESNSQYAQGGIAGVLSPEDNFENHVEDTIRAGGGLCDRDVVELVVHEAPGEIAKLLDWGTQFDLEGEQLALTREGGHSHRRIVHALGDATGHEMMRAVIERAKQAKNITIWDSSFTIDFLTDETGCVGAFVWSERYGKRMLWAKQTIVASGGCGMVYRETTNPPVATGDGMAAAYRAGAELRDMEFMQFHPTVLYVAGSSRYLISEAVRGEGAYLRDVNGKRFMLEEDERAELAPRDIVARCIFNTMAKTEHSNVYLDLSHLDPALIQHRFPGIKKVCQQYGINIQSDPIPVRPGAHYMMGGITTDTQGRTTLPGLWAAGEVTSTGLHGANRLASNSLIEGLVFGTRCGQGAAEVARSMPNLDRMKLISHAMPTLDAQQLIDIADVTNSLRALMVRKMGIVRDQKRLVEAHETVLFWCQYVLQHEFHEPKGWELQNLLTVARLMIEGAMQRHESRGTHYRSDFPEPNDAEWLRRIEFAIS